ncbi:MAG: hypothetical protein JXB13_00810 [Phycisphaerae bacterium]|nr:hypothetical protein [Phycisphaerae bacterium]
MLFHYSTGEPVQLGDRVRTGTGNQGVIELIIEPGTDEAEWYVCEPGGVLIRESWPDGSVGYLAVPFGSHEWDYHLERIERSDSKAGGEALG